MWWHTKWYGVPAAAIAAAAAKHAESVRCCVSICAGEGGLLIAESSFMNSFICSRICEVLLSG